MWFDSHAFNVTTTAHQSTSTAGSVTTTPETTGAVSTGNQGQCKPHCEGLSRGAGAGIGAGVGLGGCAVGAVFGWALARRYCHGMQSRQVHMSALPNYRYQPANGLMKDGKQAQLAERHRSNIGSDPAREPHELQEASSTADLDSGT